MQDPYLHIEDYVKGNLSEEDRLKFESAMSADGKLKQFVEDFDLVDLIGEALIEGEIAGIVGKELGKSEFGEVEIKGNSISTMRVIKWLVAAAIVLVLGWWGNSIFDQKTDAQLFAEVMVDPAWLGERSDDDNRLRYLTALHRSGQTFEATDSLKKINTSESSYWLSELYLREQKFDSTLIYLELDLPTDNNIRRDRKLYLHIIALYFSGDNLRAKTAIESLPDDVDEWYVKRLKILI